MVLFYHHDPEFVEWVIIKIYHLFLHPVNNLLCYTVTVEEEIQALKIESQNKPSEKSTSQSFWELVRFAIMALVIVIPIRIFLAEPFVVSGSSMVPTFQNGDYLIIDKISYRLSEARRFDVVIFRYPLNPEKFFIKRIIGLPNETVDIKGNVVTITNGEGLGRKDSFKLDEPYVENAANNNTHFDLKSDEYFVMGDNRNASSDSRYWGAVPRKLLRGKAFLRLLPINNIDIKPGYYEQKK